MAPRTSKAPRVRVKKNKAVLASTAINMKPVSVNQEAMKRFLVIGQMGRRVPGWITTPRENPVLIHVNRGCVAEATPALSPPSGGLNPRSRQQGHR
jgi:hypothetical protein